MQGAKSTLLRGLSECARGPLEGPEIIAPGEPDALKGASPVRWGVVGVLAYASKT